MSARRLVLVVMVLGSICAACGQGKSSTTHADGGAMVATPAGTPVVVASSPTAMATPACVQGAPSAMTSSPTAAAGSTLPTPDAAGQYRNLTFAQAQQLAPFHLAQPAWVPPCLRVAGIIASVPNITEDRPNPPLAGVPSTPSAIPATPPTGSVQVVRVSFRGPDPNEFTVVINELKQGTPLGPVLGEDVPGSQTTTMTIAGHRVTRTFWPVTAVYPQRGPSAVYVWTDHGTTFQLTALLVSPAPVKQQDIEHMIASMLG